MKTLFFTSLQAPNWSLQQTRPLGLVPGGQRLLVEGESGVVIAMYH
jgi:hypothetical protein